MKTISSWPIIFEFLELKPQMQIAEPPKKLPASLTRGIEFRGVGFRYPESDEWVLRGIDLTILPGEKIALVGHNGAGKTTLIKLLSRLYDPTEGTILIDGIDIRELDPLDLRQKIGVIFQDFVRYHLPVSENIGFGQIEAADRHGQDHRIGAQERGRRDDRKSSGRVRNHARPLVSRRPRAVPRPMAEDRAGARFYARRGNIWSWTSPPRRWTLQTEYEIFQHFKELTEGKMAILISHRFSTVRMADRIVVIERGRDCRNRQP